MKHRKYIALYLIIALLFLRFAGVHMHIHNHAPAEGQDATDVVQLGSSDDHGTSHNLDVDVNVDTSLLKKPDFDTGETLLFAAVLLLLLSRGSSFRVQRPATDTPRWATVHHLLPPATAPPA